MRRVGQDRLEPGLALGRGRADRRSGHAYLVPGKVAAVTWCPTAATASAAAASVARAAA
jgi:hypothetical protein